MKKILIFVLVMVLSLSIASCMAHKEETLPDITDGLSSEKVTETEFVTKAEKLTEGDAEDVSLLILLCISYKNIENILY